MSRRDKAGMAMCIFGVACGALGFKGDNPPLVIGGVIMNILGFTIVEHIGIPVSCVLMSGVGWYICK